MSPTANHVLERLDATRQRWWLFTLLSTTALCVSASLALFLLFMLADAFFRLPQIALFGLLVIWFAVTAGLVFLVFRRFTRNQRSLEATAIRVETQIPELRSNLINVVQLAEDTKNVNRLFCEAAVERAALSLGGISFDEAAARVDRWRRFADRMQTPRDFTESVGLFAFVVAVAVACHLLLPNWGSAAGRLLTPWKFVPSVGSVKITEVKPGNAEILLGENLTVSAVVENPRKSPYEASLIIAYEGEEEQSLPMTPDEAHGEYKLTIPSILKPFVYRLEIGDSQTGRYTVRVRQKPTVADIRVTLHYPPYLGRPEDTFSQKTADLEAPQYTVAELQIRPSCPIAKGHVMLGVQRLSGGISEDGNLMSVRVPLLENGSFTIHLINDAGHADPDPRPNRITVVPDRPPTVELLKPPRQSTASPGADLPIAVRAGDDHGLGRVRIEMKVRPAAEAEVDPEADKSPPTVLANWTEFDGGTAVLKDHQCLLDPDQIHPGDTVLIRAISCDRRDFAEWGLDLRAQQTESPWHVVRIVDRQEEAAKSFEQLEDVRSALFKILQEQIRARVGAAALAQSTAAGETSKKAQDVRTRQLDVRQSTTALTEKLGTSKKEADAELRGTLRRLANGDMVEAVGHCDLLIKPGAGEGLAGEVPKLTAVQDRIIDTLRTLLDITRKAQSEKLSEMEKRPGGDLPSDTKEKLEDIRDKLEEFLKQQKQVIEASENLAKKPVEDFSEEDEQLLKKLAQTEDDLSKFMKELHSDMSKVPEQDFANSSLLQEAVEIQTELKMAEDALTKKCLDIAVPLEQLGAEMAEEITTNMEKWLPDEADRERWSQEEYVSDEGKEAPMAELMGELEDLIGELAEEEEDLFDEMEDVSSSAADSLDKGAGWDAKDGPISDMGAKGVTGNTLPNTSEMAGRSGEGRSGKSSGEFVGDEAVGKGGRKTPSRLADDPFEKGQVKDHSKDPVGGATGGGKESGQGGEGLEGPSRRPPGQRDLQRLAGKQATLRNKAEAVDLQFKIMNYHRTDLEKMIDVMAQVERDLKTGRYQNALRQRKVLLEGLGDIKRHAGGEFEIHKDTSSNLPGNIQKELFGSMQDPSPPGWEEMNRKYYERLNAEGAATE